ncbi:hypothetical protein A2960_06525 [Candidatus Gottesmanbacteria bacterium RIFCSPLOWO2_01_FULL_39_12b]|uniref:Uncharacterized protein n=1 Tax=Candidatus Gottesmanbacteria bacterium RIFCSPLOWO2_01_FULL_39_12b TaxID=1798388 RepID=A0A1F6ARW1_9BACT|nr:MAG: hypothetical protein A2960_06525 [Candidatus Gottesmanbacteria bacterium RIFCSPLOWO2_01_FULL_39_12b]
MTFPKWMRILGLVALVAGTLITAKYFADQFTQSSEVQATQTAGSEAILYMTEEEFLNDPINQRYAEGLRLLLGYNSGMTRDEMVDLAFHNTFIDTEWGKNLSLGVHVNYRGQEVEVRTDEIGELKSSSAHPEVDLNKYLDQTVTWKGAEPLKDRFLYVYGDQAVVDEIASEGHAKVITDYLAEYFPETEVIDPKTDQQTSVISRLHLNFFPEQIWKQVEIQTGISTDLGILRTGRQATTSITPVDSPDGRKVIVVNVVLNLANIHELALERGIPLDVSLSQWQVNEEVGLLPTVIYYSTLTGMFEYPYQNNTELGANESPSSLAGEYTLFDPEFKRTWEGGDAYLVFNRMLEQTMLKFGPAELTARN